MTGLILQAGLPIGMFTALSSVLTTFGAVDGDINQAAYSIHSGLVFSIRALLVGQCAALAGLVLLAVALMSLRLRAPWLFTWGRIVMIPWLFLIPLGTVVGIIGLFYFADRRAEFLPPAKAQNESPTP